MSSFNQIIGSMLNDWNNPIYDFYNDKLQQHNWLIKHNYPTTKIYKVLNIKQLTPDDINKECVLKPSGGAAAMGVFLIIPEKNGYYNLRNGRRYNFNQIQQSIRGLKREKPFWSDVWFIEERLKHTKGNSVPYEYKCFTFKTKDFAKVELIGVNQREHGQYRARWFDRDFKAVVTGRSRKATDVRIAQPISHQAIVEMAENITNDLNLPFARIDIYETNKGLIVGELNAFDGRPEFNDYYDKKMGALFDEGLKWLR